MIFKKENKTVLKTFFLIANIIVACVAFSYIIGSVDGQNSNCANGQCSTVPTGGGSSPCANGQCQTAPSQAIGPTTGSGGLGGLGQAMNSLNGGTSGGTSGGTTTIGDISSATKGGSADLGSSANPANPDQLTGAIKGPPTGPDQTIGQQWGQGQQFPWNQGGGTVSPGPGAQTGPVTPISGPGTGGSGGSNPVYPPGGEQPIVIPGQGQGATGPGTAGALNNYFTGWEQKLGGIAVAAGLGLMVGQLAGGKDGMMWGAIAGAAGMFAYQMAIAFKMQPWQAGLIGIGVFLAIFLLTYKKESTMKVEFNCLPWQAPIGGGDCEKCNDYSECGEYTCKSLGQACDLVNKGTKDQKCVWKNPYDTNSPIIEMVNVSAGHKFVPDKSIRPPATGVQITNPNGKGQCIKAFYPLEFTFVTNEPAQCKIDYNLTTDSKLAYEEMNFYVGGSIIYSYNHTETLALPGPDAINKINPELQNDGVYTLYVRCQDANGNFNVNPFSVRFCVEKGPDETPPIIVNTSIPSRMPIQFNLSQLDLQVYVNEPAECRWSHEDRDYNLMEGEMSCSDSVWEMNYEYAYTCTTTLTGIESRKDNIFYFRCKDQPWEDESNRKTNDRSFSYIVIGTQPLNLLESGPTGTIFGATDSIPVYLTAKTDNGYNNGEAICFYSVTGNESGYIEFSNTSAPDEWVSYHTQRQDLPTGDYLYYIKCVDKGGNAVYNSTRFRVETDRIGPFIIRAYKESGEIKLVTDENAECSYSNSNCNFEVDAGLKMTTLDYINHNTEWKSNKFYYIRCKDKYNNQPNPNTCSLVVKPFEYSVKATVEGTIEL